MKLKKFINKNGFVYIMTNVRFEDINEDIFNIKDNISKIDISEEDEFIVINGKSKRKKSKVRFIDYKTGEFTEDVDYTRPAITPGLNIIKNSLRQMRKKHIIIYILLIIVATFLMYIKRASLAFMPMVLVAALYIRDIKCFKYRLKKGFIKFIEENKIQ